MSVSSFLKLQSLAAAMSQVKQLEVKIEAFVKADYEKAKAEIVEALDHFKAEVARLRTEVDARVVALIDDGTDPHTAHVTVETIDAAPPAAPVA